MANATPCFFKPAQAHFKPLYEWAFGERIEHPETTARVESILKALQACPGEFEIIEPERLPLDEIHELHSHELMTLYNAARHLPDGETFHPSVFPDRRHVQPVPTSVQQAGYYCYDSGTPLNAQTLEAASWSAACAVHGALYLLDSDDPMVYSLSRPPGHHAEYDLFGGYCYFNNAGLAANVLKPHGRVAILDIDFHHGNGTQALFWDDRDVLTISIHGEPPSSYPFFSGFAHETGGEGAAGLNLNLPLSQGCDGERYMETLVKHALPAIDMNNAAFLIVAAGFDTYKEDPVGHFQLTNEDFTAIGKRIGALQLPTLVVQEGGYHPPTLGDNAVAFLRGMRESLCQEAELQ